jgi:opacity protein-like surface antigen
MRIILCALLLSLLVPQRAVSQDVLGMSLSGGLTLASGDESDTFRRGPAIAVRTIVPISDRLGLHAAIGFQEVRLKEDAAATRANISLGEFRPGGGFAEGGNRRSLGVLVQGSFHLLPMSGRVSPYVLAGAGVSQARTTDLNVWHLGRWALQVAGDSEIVPTVDAGAGLQVRLSSAVAAFVQGSYTMLFTDGESTKMIPLHLGLLVEMGR